MNVIITFDRDPIARARELNQKITNKIIRIAMNKAASPVKAVVVSITPIKTGSLQKSMRIKIKNYRKGDIWVAIIGAKSDYTKTVKGKVVKPSRYLSIVENGGKRVRANNFLKKAASQTQANTLAILEGSIASQLNSELRG